MFDSSAPTRIGRRDPQHHVRSKFERTRNNTNASEVRLSPPLHPETPRPTQDDSAARATRHPPSPRTGNHQGHSKLAVEDRAVRTSTRFSVPVKLNRAHGKDHGAFVLATVSAYSRNDAIKAVN